MPAGSTFARLRWPGMAQAGVVSAVAYDTLDPVPRWHRGMPSSWLTLIVSVGEPVILHGAAPVPGESWPHSTASVLPTCLAGLHHRATAVRMQGRQTGVQLALDPLAAPRLLGLPAVELAGAGVDAEAPTAYRPDGREGRPEVAHAYRGGGGPDVGGHRPGRRVCRPRLCLRVRPSTAFGLRQAVSWDCPPGGPSMPGPTTAPKCARRRSVPRTEWPS